MSVKAVIFDFGGVVLDIGDFSASRLVSEVLNVPFEKAKDHIKLIIDKFGKGDISEEEFWKEMAASLNVRLPENAVGEWTKEGQMRRLFPEVIDLVKALKKEGVITAILSNTIQPHVDFIRTKGWFDYFDKVFLSNEIHLRKPDIKAYEYVLKELNIKPSEAVFIDDLKENLVPAMELGIKTILATSPAQIVSDVLAAL